MVGQAWLDNQFFKGKSNAFQFLSKIVEKTMKFWNEIKIDLIYSRNELSFYKNQSIPQHQRIVRCFRWHLTNFTPTQYLIKRKINTKKFDEIIIIQISKTETVFVDAFSTYRTIYERNDQNTWQEIMRRKNDEYYK